MFARPTHRISYCFTLLHHRSSSVSKSYLSNDSPFLLEHLVSARCVRYFQNVIIKSIRNTIGPQPRAPRAR